MASPGRKAGDGKGKTGGRQKGTPNKINAPIREAIAGMWQKYIEDGTFAADLEELDPLSRANLMERLAQYTTPKMKSIDLEMEVSASKTIEDALKNICSADCGKEIESDKDDWISDF